MPRRVPLPDDATTPFTVGDGYRLGLSEKRMRGRDLTAPFYGVRAPHHLPTGRVENTIRACQDYSPLLLNHQFFSHTTAAVLWGCPLPSHHEAASPLHLSSIAPFRAVQRQGVVGHQIRRGGGAISRRFGLRIADPLTTFLGLASMLELDDLVAVADHLILLPTVPSSGGIRPYLELPRLQHGVATFRGRGCRLAGAAAGLARLRTESRRETFLRLLLVRAGLPEPEINPDLYSTAGRWLGRADLVFREWKVIAEYDGDQHRTDIRQYESDIDRTERFTGDGWLMVKVRDGGLTRCPLETVRRVEKALQSRGWQR